MRVPMQIRSVKRGPQSEQRVESMNISLRGVYFAAKTKFELKEELKIKLHMPEQLMPGQITDWCFTGRVAHVEKLGTNGIYGIGVQFLYYTADERQEERGEAD